jgi:AhpD family alkylhydroperoxidase
MSDSMYQTATPRMSARRKALAPSIQDAFDVFSAAVFAEGALNEKTKQLIAVAVAHVTQCPYCITGHTKLARRKGAMPEEIMEAIWVAAEMRAGGAFAHAALAIHAMDRIDAHTHSPGVESSQS